jgi:hypothetical protein
MSKLIIGVFCAIMALGYSVAPLEPVQATYMTDDELIEALLWEGICPPELTYPHNIDREFVIMAVCYEV